MFNHLTPMALDLKMDEFKGVKTPSSTLSEELYNLDDLIGAQEVLRRSVMNVNPGGDPKNPEDRQKAINDVIAEFAHIRALEFSSMLVDAEQLRDYIVESPYEGVLDDVSDFSLDCKIYDVAGSLLWEEHTFELLDGFASEVRGQVLSEIAMSFENED